MPGWRGQRVRVGGGAGLGGRSTGCTRLASATQRPVAGAQQELADLAVTEERARIAADLHDILGHSLTVVTVKAELAQRLLDVDVEQGPRRAAATWRCSPATRSADVRTTAMGVRGISLPGEIAAARSALAAADVAAELPGAADEVPSRWRELFAWTIREAVTNIVRHARRHPLRGAADPGQRGDPRRRCRRPAAAAPTARAWPGCAAARRRLGAT